MHQVDRERNREAEGERVNTHAALTGQTTMEGTMGIAVENSETSALAMAKNYLHFDRYTSLDELFSRIDAVTSFQVKEVTNQIFSTTPFELSYL